MRLKSGFLLQTLGVLAVTVILTLWAGLIYGYFFKGIADPSRDEYTYSAAVIMKGQDIIYNDMGLSRSKISEIKMNGELKRGIIDLDGESYRASANEEIAKDGQKYTVIKLEKLLAFSDYYKNITIFVTAVFLVTFLIASAAASNSNLKNIINPIVYLTHEADRLKNGELNNEIKSVGRGEVKELCNAVEKLRIKLKEAVYYQEKYDDNRKFLISSISHDLKTPVAAISGYLEGLLDNVPDSSEKRQSYLESALKKTEIMKTMIDDLLLYSKLDLNQIPFDLTTVNLADYIFDCVDENDYIFSLENKSIEFEDNSDEQCYVKIDLMRFKRVVQNILDNARKHIEKNEGKVVIRLRDSHAAAIIEIKDNGCGISPDALPHIFERFYRADSARKIEGSSGLGLAIARQIVELHGGRIWAVSKLNEGTGILISLKKQKITGGR